MKNEERIFFYRSWWVLLSARTPTVRHAILDAVFSKVFDDAEPDFYPDSPERMAYDFIIHFINENLTRYERKREAGRARWQARADGTRVALHAGVKNNNESNNENESKNENENENKISENKDSLSFPHTDNSASAGEKEKDLFLNSSSSSAASSSAPAPQQSLPPPPTWKEVEAFAKETQRHPDIAAQFFDHYQSIGWKRVGGLPIVDWKAAFRCYFRKRADFIK